MRLAIIALSLLLPSILAAPLAQAQSVTITDPVGDFLPSYTAGPQLADLDVTSFSLNYNSATSIFTIGATFAGPINPTTAGFYVFGVNTGTGTSRPFAAIGEGNVIFNQAIVIQKNGTGTIGATALSPSSITISGNSLTALVPLSLLPSTGFSPLQYGFNLWPRIGSGSNSQITDFSPENATLAISPAPEPATWASMLVGLTGAGGWARRRRKLVGALTSRTAQ